MFETILKIMSLIGLPSLVAIVVYLFKLGMKIRILMKAVQAQMRSSLLADYKMFMEQGWISDDDLLEWENQYQAYHQLGQNGVLDKRRDQLMELPNQA